MSIEKPDNERLALYNRFKSSLAPHSGDEEFFDADDLVIIIDQAVDLNDEYVEIEAIMRGYRFFPDNEELKARRAFLYYDLNLDEGVDNMRADMSAESPLTEILTMRRMEETADRATFLRMLNGIVDAPGLLDDETIIQLVDCASACGCYDWLKTNEKKLRTKTDYLPTLLYELFIVADMQHDREYSLKLLDELTELEPFNIDFWNALAQLQAMPETDSDGNITAEADLEASLTATDYALAIDSENIQALTLKASILLQQGNAAGSVAILEPLAGKMPDPAGCGIYVRALYETGRIDEAMNRIVSYCKQFIDSRDLLGTALAMDAPGLPELLEAHYLAVEKQHEDPAGEWAEWARAYYRDARLREAIMLMDVLRSRELLDYQTFKLYVSALYCLGRYTDCIDCFEEVIEKTPELLMPNVVIAGMMSYLRSGDKRAARGAMKRLAVHFPITIKDDWTLASNLESIGMSHFVSAIQSTLDAPGPIDIDELDIFRFPTPPSPQQ